MDPASESKKSKFIRWVVMVLLSSMVVLTLLSIIFTLQQYFSPENSPTKQKSLTKSQMTISGMIDLNGTAPMGSTIVIAAKEDGQSSKTVVEDLPAHDNASWTWSDAKPDTEYTIKAALMYKGKVLATSQTIVVPAPARTQTFRINLPDKKTEANTRAAISGMFHINGFIPPGSIVSLAKKKFGESSFSVIDANIVATDHSGWTWSDAGENQSYSVQATLLDPAGKELAKSEAITVTAPATGEVLTLQSSASPSTSSRTTITGRVEINGSIPTNDSSISIAIRESGQGEFVPVTTNFAAVDGISWTYPNAQIGKTYDIQATLWQNTTRIARSQILTVPASAIDQILIIQAMTPPAKGPTKNSLSVTCTKSDPQTHLWQVTVNFNTTSGLDHAKQYLLTIGTTPGGDQQLSLITHPKNPNQTQTLITQPLFSGPNKYFAAYAYASCANCHAFSPPSQPVPFSCGGDAPDAPSPTSAAQKQPKTLPVTPTITLPVRTLTVTPVITPSNSATPTSTSLH